MTKLIYLEQMQLLECSSVIIDIKSIDDVRYDILLDETVFYPQGGGQPFDNGVICNNDGQIFNVDEVRFLDGQVHHFGMFKANSLPIFNIGDKVSCKVQKDRRDLNARLHSAGHLIDMGLFELGNKWKPSKGYHFPQGSYVEYELADNIVDDNLLKQLENKCNEIINRNIETDIRFVNKDEMSNYCHFVPDCLPDDKPSRVVFYADFGVPCGGIHCKNLSEIKQITIRKIKKDKNAIRVSYDLVL